MNDLNTQNRQIRVFISSTFRDMMKERDLLVKEVFPELRRKCAKRFVTFTEVDLRWGITEAQANEGQVLPLCLAEIERSRPYFIGLLGERYGWIPDTIRPEVIEQEPWLKEHIQERTSVTELEILHGVLNNPMMQGHSFFYFRDPAYGTDSALNDDERRDMVEHDIKADIEKYGPAEATRRTEERKAKLAALKQRIRDSKLPLVEPYADPKALAEIVRKQFNELIDRLFPEDQMPDPLAQERMAHEAHAKNKLFACIDRPEHLATINAFASKAEHSGKGLVVTGESGGGKTALLAAWARDWANEHPEDFLFQHYFGATPDSASPEGFLRRLLGELKNRFGLTDDIPTGFDKLRDALPVWLAQTMGKGRIVLVLNGLNQVQGDEPNRRLLFLPRHFPSHITVLASALPGPALDALRERGWKEHELPRASQAEVDAMVGEYLKIHARALEPKLRHQLVTAPGAKNPLFLRTVLEELRQFGSFERLPERVRHYIEADNPKDLFLRVLARWQEDFDGKDPDGSSLAPTGADGRHERAAHIVRRALTHLWAARQGLSEPEWLDLLGIHSSTYDLGPMIFDPLPRALWTPLFLALEPHLSQHNGLFAFGHDFLRQAIEAAFIPSTDTQQAAHLSVADYFERHAHQQEMNPRKASEWPYQLHAAQAWARLEACLTDIPLFLALCNDMTKWELTGYWHPLRQHGIDMGGCYSETYARWTAIAANADDHFVPNQLGAFLMENGLYSSAESLLRRCVEMRSGLWGMQHPSTLVAVNNLAGLLGRKSDYAEAEEVLRLAAELCEVALGPNNPQTLISVNNLAGFLYNKADYAGAEPLYRGALEASKSVLGPVHARTLMTINNLALVLQNMGNLEEAESLFHSSLETAKQVLGTEHPFTIACTANVAGLLGEKGDYVGAEQLYRWAFAVQERVMGPEHPDTLTSADNLAGLLETKKDYAGSEALYRQVLVAREKVLGQEQPDTLKTLNNLGYLLARKGDFDQAEKICQRALEGRERIFGLKNQATMVSAGNLAFVLKQKDDYKNAETLLARILSVWEKSEGLDHPGTIAAAANMAELFAAQSDFKKAEPLARRVFEFNERKLGPEHADTISSADTLAFVLARKGEYKQAEPLLRRVLAASEARFGDNHSNTLMCLNNLAGLLVRKGDYAEAESLYRRAIEELLTISVLMERFHPNLQPFISCYGDCLARKGCSREEIRNTLNKMFETYGISLEGDDRRN